MAVRAAVPLGFMPDLARLAGGVFEIVICSPGGIGTITVDAAGNPVAHHPDTDPHPVHDGLCPFAAAAALATAAMAVGLIALFRWPERLHHTLFRVDLASAPGPGPLGPRAPPLL